MNEMLVRSIESKDKWADVYIYRQII